MITKNINETERIKWKKNKGSPEERKRERLPSHCHWEKVNKSEVSKDYKNSQRNQKREKCPPQLAVVRSLHFVGRKREANSYFSKSPPTPKSRPSHCHTHSLVFGSSLCDCFPFVRAFSLEK